MSFSRPHCLSPRLLMFVLLLVALVAAGVSASAQDTYTYGLLPSDTSSWQPGPLPQQESYPYSLDWRNMNGNNYVTGVRNQGSCGSCWAFAATGALEAKCLIALSAPNSEINLSEQTLVSCSPAGSCAAGGYIDAASEFFRTTGIPTESCFPYAAADISCSYACANWQQQTYKIGNWYGWSGAYVDLIKSAVQQYGPAAVSFHVYSDFESLPAGQVYHWSSGSTYRGDHAVLVVGWDDARSCFIVKNSWGTIWGDNGYFLMGYTEVSSPAGFGYNMVAYDGVTAPGNATYQVTGTILKSGGAPLANVVVTAAGPVAVQTATTNASGVFTFTLANGTYGISPKLNGWGFTPTSRSVTVNGAGVSGVAFAAFPTYSIAGTVTYNGTGLSGATVVAMGGNFATTNSSGNYTISGLPNGTYSVNAGKAGYYFTPCLTSKTISGANVTGVNFTGAVGYTISGTVTCGGVGLESVSLTSDYCAYQGAVTATNGTYTTLPHPTGTYTLTPSLSGYVFTPPSQTVSVGNSNVTGVTFVAQRSYTISGTVTYKGTGLAGVTVTAGTSSAITGSGGAYTLPGVVNGAYTVTPSLSPYTFTPASRPVTVSGSNVTGVNFAVATYTITGTVTLNGAAFSGVAVSASGPVTASATTTSTGAYTLSNLIVGSYTVTPSKSGYAFAPASSPVTITAANVTGVNFSSTGSSISGKVTANIGGGVANVTVAASGAASLTATTGTDGTYTLAGLPTGHYTVTPSKTGYRFTPTNQSLDLTTAGITNINFTGGATYTVAGRITAGGYGLPGATVSATGSNGSATATTNSSGDYTLSGLVNGTYTVQPSFTGALFTPASRSVTVNNASQTGVNFASRLSASVQLLANAGLESGNTGWTTNTSPDTGHGVITGNSCANWAAPHGGAKMAQLCGGSGTCSYFNGETDVLKQTVTIPWGANSVSLVFWYAIFTNETATTANDVLNVELVTTSGTVVATPKTLSNLNKTTGWAQTAGIDLTAYQGQQLQLRFKAITNGTKGTVFLIDDTSLIAQ